MQPPFHQAAQLCETQGGLFRPAVDFYTCAFDPAIGGPGLVQLSPGQVKAARTLCENVYSDFVKGSFGVLVNADGQHGFYGCVFPDPVGS